MTNRSQLLPVLLVVGTVLSSIIYFPFAPASDPKRLLALVLGLTASAFLLSAPKSLTPPRPASHTLLSPSLAYVVFVAVSALSLSWGRSPGLLDLASWVASLCLLAFVQSLPSKSANLALGISATTVASISSCVALGQYARGARGLLIHGWQGNANWLGLLIAVCFPLSLGLAIRNSNSKLRLLNFTLVLLQLAGLYLSHSRVAWIATLVAALSCASGLLTTQKRRRLALTTSLLLGLCALVYVNRSPAKDLDTNSFSEDVPVTEAFRGRTWIWEQSLKAIPEHFPLGTGLGGFSHAFLAQQGKSLGQLPPKVASRKFANATTAHNEWLQTGLETGALGFVSFLFTIGFALRLALQQKKTETAGAFIALAICACGDSPIRMPAIVLLLAIALGSLEENALVLRYRRPFAACSFLTCLVLLPAALSTLMASRVVHQSYNFLLYDKIRLLEKATRIDPRSGEASLQLGLARLELGENQSALDELRRSETLLANLGTLVAIGNAQAKLGRLDEACESYERALALHPAYFRAHANLVEALRLKGDLENARLHLKLARETWPGHPRLADLAQRLERTPADALR